MVISGTLIPQRTRTALATDQQITGLTIRAGVMRRGQAPLHPSILGTYRINNWKSYPKLVAAAQSCQDNIPTSYCSISLEARIKPISTATTVAEHVMQVGAAVTGHVMQVGAAVTGGEKLVDIIQLIEVCTSRATGQSVPIESCKPGVEYEGPITSIIDALADIGQIVSCGMGPCTLPDGSRGNNTIAGCIRIPPTPPTRPTPRQIPRQPAVTPDFSKYLIAGCVTVSLFLSLLALKSSR
jgi:hypothetical protein